MAPDRTQLQNLSLKSNECFKEYAQRWREMASRVQPPMLEKEMANMFMNTLPRSYLERMVVATPPILLMWSLPVRGWRTT